MYDFWVVLVLSLVALNASLIGTFLVLRRAAMMADAISHATLLGIVLAFLWTGQNDAFLLQLGAASSGLVAIAVIGLMQTKLGLQQDTAIGATFTTFFALGILLIALYTQKVDLDQECVLFGDPALVPFDLWGSIPKAVYTLSSLLVANICFFFISYRTMCLTTFDADFSSTLGVNTLLWHYLLMGMTSITCVMSFQAVGVVPMVALLVVPAATAYLVTISVLHMLCLAPCFGLYTVFIGYALGNWLEASITGAVASATGLWFMMILIGYYMSKKHFQSRL